MLCLYATWCLLFCPELTEGVVSVLSMSYFSLRGDSGGGLRARNIGGGRGEYLELTVASLLGLGWDGVMCGFAFNVLFTKVIVLFLYCVGKVYAYFQ